MGLYILFPNSFCKYVLKIATPYPRIYVLLTVLLSIILDNDQLDTHLLYFKIGLL